MARFSALLTFITTAATLSTVYAGPVGGPACAAQNRGQPDCFEKCKTSWGFNGGTLGADRWGPVVVPSKTLASINEYIAKACGLSAAPEPTASKPAGRIEVPAVANAGGVPSTANPTPVATSSLEVSSSSLRSQPTISLVAAPSVSSSAVSSASFVPPAENFVTRPEPTTSQAPPPPPPTTEAPPPPPTTQAPPPPPPTTQAPRPPPTTQAPAPQPTPVTPPATGGGSGGARQEWLNTHNAVRARHGANPVTWGDDLEAAALRWAQGCVFQHSGGAVGKFGENLAAGTGDYTPTKALNGWAAEVSEYNPSNPQFSHFTQVVWKATTRIGCATVVCNNNMIPGFGGPTSYHVCEYDPPGNFAGRFAENVQV